MNINPIADLLDRNLECEQSVAYLYGPGSLTFRDLRSQSLCAATYFYACGIRPRQVVALCCEDSILWPVAWFGLVLLGAVPLAVPPRPDPDRLDSILARSQAVAVVVDRSCSRLPHSQIVLDQHMIDHAEPLAAKDIYQPGYNDTVLLLLSSGTTGLPKIIAHRRGPLLQSFAYTKNPYGLNNQCRLYCSIQLGTSWGMIMALLGNLASGYSVIVPRAITDFHHIADFLASQQATHAMLSPRALSFMIKHCPELPQSLNTVFISGDHCAPDVIETFQHKFRIPVLNSYGCSEVRCWAVLTEQHNDQRTGSVGRPGPGVELMLVDSQDQPVATGEVGRLCVRHGGILKQYLDDNDTAAYIKHGWYHTQDYMRQDRDGFYYYLGKATDAADLGILETECKIRDLLATDDVVVLIANNKKIAFVASLLAAENQQAAYLVDELRVVSEIPSTPGSAKKSRDLETLQKYVVQL